MQTHANAAGATPCFTVIDGGLSGAFAHLAQASPVALREMTQVAGGQPMETLGDYRRRSNLDRVTRRRNPDL